MRQGFGWFLVIGLAAGALAAPAAGQSAIRVIVNGSPLSLAAPALLQGGQVMVPAARAFESFGAAAVWLHDERAVLISNRSGMVIRLRVGEAVAQVNGQPRPLPVAPAMVGDFVYVPAQFVFGALGAWVRYDETARTLHVASQITALSVQRAADAVRLVLNATGPLRAETRVLVDPDRLVVDLHGGAFRPADQELVVGYAGVARVRAAQFQIKPYITRVVFDLQQSADVRLLTSATSFDLTIEVRPHGIVAAVPYAPPVSPASPVSPAIPPPGPLPAPGPAPTPVDDPHAQPVPIGPVAPVFPDDGMLRILQVRVEQLGTRFRVLIEATRPFEYTVRELLEPDRLVIDIPGGVFVPVKQEIPVAGAVVTEVRAAQFQADPDVTRIVVVLKYKAAHTVTSANGDGSVLVIEIPEPSVRAHVVAIDAGHGGRDMGATGPTGLLEKDVILDISQRVRELLVRAGIRVVMTRETDAFVELADRPRIARQQGATVFVSIHANASTRSTSNGSETYYLYPQSQVLAQMVQEELGRIAGLVNRGTKTANFLVLRENEIPAVLVEVAYLSNLDEEARLRATAFRQRLAEAITRGVQRFLAVYPVPAN